MPQRQRPFFLFAIAALLFVVPVYHNLVLDLPYRHVRDPITREIVGTEPNPAYVQRQRAAWVLGGMGVIVTGIGIAVSIRNRKSAAKGDPPLR